jgi:hypothetical protein
MVTPINRHPGLFTSGGAGQVYPENLVLVRSASDFPAVRRITVGSGSGTGARDSIVP